MCRNVLAESLPHLGRSSFTISESYVLKASFSNLKIQSK